MNIGVKQEFAFEEHELRNVNKPNANSQPVTQNFSTDDDIELIRLGKNPVLKRNFGFLSILGFSCTVLISWEGILATFLQDFANGGPAGTAWGFLLVWIGTLSTFVSIAELASMAPTSGGWQALTASSGFLMGTIIQGMILLCNPGYTPTAWQSLLLYWATIAFAVFINTVAGPALAKFEGIVLVIHIVGFFAILIPLVYMGPHGDPVDVFTTFLNEGNWDTQGVSFLVGLSGASFVLTGADSAVHMSEEIKNAGLVVPRALISAIFINGLLAFAMVIAVLFCMGDIQNVLAAQETFIYPFYEIFLQATNSVAGSAVMGSIIIVMGICGLVGGMASASRQLWSFSRDRGVPFWKQVSRLDRRTSIPVHAIIVTICISVALSFIILGSSTVFNDVISLTTVSLYSSYLVCCSLLLWRRVTGAIAPYNDFTTVVGQGNLSWGRWRLPSRIGTANNAFSCCYLLVVLIFSFFPATSTVTPGTMNYAALVYGATVVFSIFWYLTVAKGTYVGPVQEVKIDKLEPI